MRPVVLACFLAVATAGAVPVSAAGQQTAPSDQQGAPTSRTVSPAPNVEPNGFGSHPREKHESLFVRHQLREFEVEASHLENESRVLRNREEAFYKRIGTLPRARATCGAASLAAGFLTKISYLKTPGFDPVTNGGTGNGAGLYNPPQSDATPVPSNYVALFRKAFTIAPGGLQTALCMVNNVYIDTMYDPDGWAFWEAPPQAPQGQGKLFIGISERLLSKLVQPAPLTLSDLEAGILRGLVLNLPNGVTFSKGDPRQDTPEMALLAVLAHEMGHLLFADQLNTIESCGFFANSWTGALAFPDRFHQFGIDNPAALHKNGEPYKDEIESDFRRHRTYDGIQKLGTLYGANISAPNSHNPSSATSTAWVSLFSAVAPDEDFAETYKLVVLRNAQQGEALTSLTLQFPDTSTTNVSNALPVNIVANMNSAALQTKARCINLSMTP